MVASIEEVEDVPALIVKRRDIPHVFWLFGEESDIAAPCIS
jgi:hypothetical protein